LRRKIVEHDDIGAGRDGFTSFGEGLTFDVDAECEAGGGFGSANCFCDVALRAKKMYMNECGTGQGTK
jgi:hypothetical protein